MPTDQHPLLQVATLILVPAIAALLGAWAGAKTAFIRFKSERAFDKKLLWLESVFAECVNLSNVQAELEEDLRIGGIQFIHEDLERIISAARRLEELIPLSKVFGSSQTQQAADNYQKASRKISAPLAVMQRAPDSVAIDQLVNDLQVIAAASKSTHDALTAFTHELTVELVKEIQVHQRGRH
jgi:hypothetical protein